ncbi:molecular chaperone DnaJ [Brevibacterium album]|uniref:molecular chaperone DnaJ n=1 Tax=Brevibacterium album TaxID=417948 RepID=UPI0003FBA6FC|nr:molecular chaperone DnaJ [Brevibacterium album]
MSDHYETLGVSKDASDADIKKAYRRLARKLHPDVSPGSEDEFKRVSLAYDVLSDPEKRRNYDMGGGENGQAGPGAGFGGFSDLFETFFGGGASAGGRPQPASRTRRGKDALVALRIDLATAAFGGTADVDIVTAHTCETCSGSGARPGTEVPTCSMCHGAGSVQQMTRTLLGQMVTNQTCPQCRGYGTVIEHPCVTCHGDGRVRADETITVKVPAGVRDGNRIQLSGRGEAGPGGGPRGDLFLEVIVEEHPVFTRDGADLRCTLAIPMTAAALGAEIPLETFDGEQIVEVRPGAQTGDVVRLRGLGAEQLRREGRGDIFVTLTVETPGALTEEQRELLEQLAQLRGESAPSGRAGDRHTGPFSRLREKFAGR